MNIGIHLKYIVLRKRKFLYVKYNMLQIMWRWYSHYAYIGNLPICNNYNTYYDVCWPKATRILFYFFKTCFIICVNKKKLLLLRFAYKIEVKGYCLLVLFDVSSYNSYRLGQQGKSIELKMYSYILGGWLYNILRFISVPYYHSDYNWRWTRDCTIIISYEPV